MTQALNGQPLSDVLNAPCNDADAQRLRGHIRDKHRSLLDPVVDGPLPSSGLSRVPNEVLAAIHTANHLGVWSDHRLDTWERDPVETA